MDVDDHGTLAGECSGRAIKKPGDRLSVKAVPMDEFRFRKLLYIKLANDSFRPQLGLTSIRVERINVIGRARRFKIESQVNRVIVSFEIGYDANRQRGRHLLFAGLSVE